MSAKKFFLVIFFTLMLILSFFVNIQAKALVEYSGTRDDHIAYVHELCNIHGCDGFWILKILECESDLNPTASNRGVYLGIAQFHPNTFYANAARKGVENPNVWNSYQQIYTMIRMITEDQGAWHWSCVNYV